MISIDFTCLLAAALSVIGNILQIVYFFIYHNAGLSNQAKFTQMHAGYIRQEWEFRYEHSALELAAGCINAVAWFILLLPLVKVAWVLSDRFTRQLGIHISIIALAAFGSGMELLSRLMYIGATNTVEWISVTFNLSSWTGLKANDQVGWRVLQIVYMGLRGVIVWIDSVEWLCLFGIFLLMFWSVRTKNDELFGRKFGYTCVVLAALSLIDFAAEIMRFKKGSHNTFGSFAIMISIVNRLLLLPCWLVWLGRKLPTALSGLQGKPIVSDFSSLHLHQHNGDDEHDDHEKSSHRMTTISLS